MNYDCNRCQDRTVVGGFLPSPCPECRAADANPHVADLCHELVLARRDRDEWCARACNDENWRTHLTAERDALLRERDMRRKGGFDGIDALADKLGKAESERDAAIRERDDIRLVLEDLNDDGVEYEHDLIANVERDTAEMIAAWLDYLGGENEKILAGAVRHGAWKPAISALDSAKEKP